MPINHNPQWKRFIKNKLHFNQNFAQAEEAETIPRHNPKRFQFPKYEADDKTKINLCYSIQILIYMIYSLLIISE